MLEVRLPQILSTNSSLVQLIGKICARKKELSKLLLSGTSTSPGMKGRSPCLCFSHFLSQTGQTQTPTQHAELHLIPQGIAKHKTDTAVLA